MKINDPTHLLLSTTRRFSYTLAVWLALGAPSVPAVHAATDAANATVLSTHLPANVTLTKASIDQVAGALREAVKQHHDDAVDLLRIAILAKEPKPHHGILPCPDLRKLVQAAASQAADKMSQLVDVAASLDPDCADTLQTLVAGAVGADEAGGFDGSFGVGFGPGFPGSPGFVGSPPSGSVSLPAASPTPVTSTTND